MFDVNQFVITAKYVKVKTINNEVYLYLKTANNGELRFIIGTAIKDKLQDYCCVNDIMAVKGYVSADYNHSILLYATKLTFLSNKKFQ